MICLNAKSNKCLQEQTEYLVHPEPTDFRIVS